MNRIEPKSHIKKSKQKCFGFFLSQPVTGLASIAFGYPNASRGVPPPPAKLHRLILFKE